MCAAPSTIDAIFNPAPTSEFSSDGCALTHTVSYLSSCGLRRLINLNVVVGK